MFPPTYEPIVKRTGLTAAERYLEKLCRSTFLSLWSYPSIFRDQGGGKEVCDLIVVFEDDVIVFSDKDCAFSTTSDIRIEWGRWFKAAVKRGAKQAWGAERWIREFPERVFLDEACTQRLPIPLPPRDRMRFHLIVVAHGASAACATHLGGSGSMMLRSDLRGVKSHTEPFMVGDLDPSRAFVHVFDDTTLDVVLRTRDTVSDFVAYLRKKETFFRAREVIAGGEEELLAYYLRHLNSDDEHDFVIPPDATGGIAIPEGHWLHFVASGERQRQIDHDSVSYFWDELVESFGKTTLQATQYAAAPGGFSSSEKLLRFMAREPRLRRRMLAGALLALLKKTPPDERALRLVAPTHAGDPYYVFVLFPLDSSASHDENRARRNLFLLDAVKVTRLKFADALDIIGIATESGTANNGRSEDALYLDGRLWSEADAKEAGEIQARRQILVNPTFTHRKVDEYPRVTRDGRLAVAVGKNPRNKPCPCGSGEKYKRCHGR